MDKIGLNQPEKFTHLTPTMYISTLYIVWVCPYFITKIHYVLICVNNWMFIFWPKGLVLVLLPYVILYIIAIKCCYGVAKEWVFA